MIDVTFLLLIFFMCTLHFTTLEGRLSAHMPKDAGPSARAERKLEPVSVILRVVAEGTRLAGEGVEPWSGVGAYRYGPDRVIEYRVGPRHVRDLESAGAILRELRRETPELGLVLDAREGVVHAEVVALLDRAVELGFSDVRFAAAR